MDDIVLFTSFDEMKASTRQDSSIWAEVEDNEGFWWAQPAVDD